VKYAVIAIIIACTAQAQAINLNPFSWFGSKKTNVELQNLKNSTNKRFADMTAEIGVVKDNQTEINQKLDSVIKAQAQVKARAQLGYDRSQNTDTTAGRDVSIINDPGVLKTVIGALVATNGGTAGLCMFIVYVAFKNEKQKKQFKGKYYGTVRRLKNARQAKESDIAAIDKLIEEVESECTV
jgi:hypothetical protein